MFFQHPKPFIFLFIKLTLISAIVAPVLVLTSLIPYYRLSAEIFPDFFFAFGNNAFHLELTHRKHPEILMVAYKK